MGSVGAGVHQRACTLWRERVIDSEGDVRACVVRVRVRVCGGGGGDGRVSGGDERSS